MKLIIDKTKYEILTVMQAIKADRDSWQDWLCLKVDLPTKLNERDLMQLHANTGLIIENVMAEKSASVYFSGSDQILVFCKNETENFFRELGLQLQEMAVATSGHAANFTVYNVERDAEHLTSGYSWQDLKENHETLLETPASNPTPQLPETSPAHTATVSRKVLLVEDDPVTRWMVRTALKDECFLATAQNAGKALAAYQTYKPDMVLLDINLPDRDGKEVMARIMKSDPGAYIVMFSSHDTLENITGAISNGARGFIAKPFSRDKILQYVRECPTGR